MKALGWWEFYSIGTESISLNVIAVLFKTEINQRQVRYPIGKGSHCLLIRGLFNIKQRFILDLSIKPLNGKNFFIVDLRNDFNKLIGLGGNFVMISQKLHYYQSLIAMGNFDSKFAQ